MSRGAAEPVGCSALPGRFKLWMDLFVTVQHIDKLRYFSCTRFSFFYILNAEQNCVPILAVEGCKELLCLGVSVQGLLQIIGYGRGACR